MLTPPTLAKGHVVELESDLVGEAVVIEERALLLRAVPELPEMPLTMSVTADRWQTEAPREHAYLQCEYALVGSWYLVGKKNAPFVV